MRTAISFAESYNFGGKPRLASARQGLVAFRSSPMHPRRFVSRVSPHSILAVAFFLLLASPVAVAQQATSNEVQELRTLVLQLQQRVANLEAQQAANSASAPSQAVVVAAQPAPMPSAPNQTSASSPTTVPATLAQIDHEAIAALRDTTVNVSLDGYYDYNFNNPVGRVNALRAYDVLSNNFSLNQASLVVEHAPDLTAGRRFGGRVDLQFGQATDTLAGNPANEPRPQIYRNIFQAYGSYIAPVGKGLNIDFGKWSSSLGYEGNYTKDQLNYSRSYWFNFLPFYHMGVRANYKFNDQFAVNYWIVNGTNQAEATNGYKDEMFGFVSTPRKSITWTFNYYLGQENPDRIAVTTPSPVNVQPGLTFVAISPAPNGKTHIFDSYVNWNATPKLAFALEGDYVIQRMWQNSAPGESSTPKRDDGGAAYIHYQLTPKLALAGRGEYLMDHGGAFSNINQALKEATATFDYQLSDGFLMRYEFRRDFSNTPTFFTDAQGILARQQTTATLGLVWWWGQKQGPW
jgi:hypothetical protein